jgi:hypothetical protein
VTRAKRRADGSIVLLLTVEAALAVRTAITLCVAMSPEGVPIPEAREMGEVVGAIDIALRLPVAPGQPRSSMLCAACRQMAQDDWTYCPYCGAQGREMAL